MLSLKKKFLIESNADVNVTDYDGNTPLHTKCAGEINKPVELEAIQMLHEYGAQLDRWNLNGDTCFHVAARNGHTDVLQLLFELDEQTVRESVRLSEEKSNEQSESTLAMALRSDHLDCATW